MFDVEEYLQLAVHASLARQHHACIGYLKEALLQQPHNAQALYMLAIEHAQLGLVSRAIRGIKAALAIQPRMEVARLQLGMLLLEKNLQAEAKEQFAVLGGSDDAALRAYAQAMTALSDGDRAAARQGLASGLAQTTSYPAFRPLMRQLHERLSKEHAAGEGPVDEGPDPKAQAQGQRIFMGAYRESPT